MALAVALVASGAGGVVSDDTLLEKGWEQLSDKDLSDWGRRALGIESGKWKHGETKHFVIHYFRNGQRIATRSEAFYAEIREFFGNRADLLGGRKSHVFAMHEQDDWQKFTRAIGLAGIGGVTRGNEFFYLSTGDDGRFETKAKVQAHEMTHLVFNRFFEGRPPLWLNEGIAEYFGERKTSSTVEFRRRMGRAPDFDVASLMTATAYPAGQGQIEAFYAESAIVVDFLTMNPERRALLPKFVDALIGDGDLNKALAVYGYKDFDAFSAAYEKYRRRRF